MSNIIIIDSDEEIDYTSSNINADANITMEQDMPQTSIVEVQNEIPNGSTRRRPRKSVLYIKPNTEVQFEMISNENIASMPSTLTKKPQKTFKIIQNIPDPDGACEKFLSSSEVKDLINRIAEERVRINYLLTTNNMPKMQFSLYTLFEKLQSQFDKRLDSLKLQQNEMPNVNDICSNK